MDIISNSGNILAILDNFTLDNSGDIAKQVADDFRKRRVEKNTRIDRCREIIDEVHSGCKELTRYDIRE
ncbi:MAG: hypothetical protein K2J74_00525 [Muribaculaceae bacterium]|nr:hypothetical protein [Muribaculaceae bacterium]